MNKVSSGKRQWPCFFSSVSLGVRAKGTALEVLNKPRRSCQPFTLPEGSDDLELVPLDGTLDRRHGKRVAAVTVAELRPGPYPSLIPRENNGSLDHSSPQKGLRERWEKGSNRIGR